MMQLLYLLQLADSALPVGGLAHSFGLESLVELGFLQPDGLESFLRGWLTESGALDAAFCARACSTPAEFATLNVRLAARKTARESRQGSAAMGRRLLDLAARAYGIAVHAAGGEVQYPCCFGYVAGALDIEPGDAAAAFLQQSVAAMIFAGQRLMPLGHTQAQTILFRLKSAIADAACATIDAPSFTPLIETASMCHSRLMTRLFIS
jgi:urease accessory protein